MKTSPTQFASVFHWFHYFRITLPSWHPHGANRIIFGRLESSVFQQWEWKGGALYRLTDVPPGVDHAYPSYNGLFLWFFLSLDEYRGAWARQSLLDGNIEIPITQAMGANRGTARFGRTLLSAVYANGHTTITRLSSSNSATITRIRELDGDWELRSVYRGKVTLLCNDAPTRVLLLDLVKGDTAFLDYPADVTDVIIVNEMMVVGSNGNEQEDAGCLTLHNIVDAWRGISRPFRKISLPGYDPS
jgi:hypothetical protein